MKKISYIFLLIFGLSLLHSCEVDSDIPEISDSPNLAKFENYRIDLKGLANGSEYNNKIQVKVNGPTLKDLSTEITVTVEAGEMSTAIEGTHFRIPEKTITLSKSNNYLANIDIVLVTEGNTPPMDGTPEFDAYIAPVLYLDIVSATGDASVVPTGKSSVVTMRYITPNPYAGTYTSEIYYYHPTLGGSHPSLGADFDPSDPFIHQVEEKELEALTGRTCETGFAIWGADGDLCWITINVDNSISYENDVDEFGEEAKLGNPYDASQVSYYDPETGIIHLYYHYDHSNGSGIRVFFETLTPLFE